MTTSVIRRTQVQVVDPDQVPPFVSGLYAEVEWQNDPHFLINAGVVFRPMNFGGETAFGVLDGAWCTDPSAIEGVRPDIDTLSSNPFTLDTVWSSDQTQCADLSVESRQEVRDRVLHNFMRLEQIAAERQFAERLLDDAGSPAAATDIRDAVGQIEDIAAGLGVGGEGLILHMRPYYATASYGLFVKDDDNDWATNPLGSDVVFGGGYTGGSGLGNTIVATSPIYGWQSTTPQLEIIEYEDNLLYSLVERSVLLGYEKLIAAVTIS